MANPAIKEKVTSIIVYGSATSKDLKRSVKIPPPKEPNVRPIRFRHKI